MKLSFSCFTYRIIKINGNILPEHRNGPIHHCFTSIKFRWIDVSYYFNVLYLPIHGNRRSIHHSIPLRAIDHRGAVNGVHAPRQSLVLARQRLLLLATLVTWLMQIAVFVSVVGRKRHVLLSRIVINWKALTSFTKIVSESKLYRSLYKYIESSEYEMYLLTTNYKLTWLVRKNYYVM